MDDISTRTIIIAVNIFITITIVSLVIAMFSQIGDIYGNVASVDTSIASRFDDIYSMYHGRVESGIGLLNTVKTYSNEEEYYDDYGKVIIVYSESNKIREYIEKYNLDKSEENQITEVEYIKIMMEKEKLTKEQFEKKYGKKYNFIEKIGSFSYEDKYNIVVEEDTQKDIVIKYTKINK